MPGLNPFDDYPFHQTAAPIDVPATSDTHYNDGYYFAFYRPGVHVFCGLRLHPNSNVMDGYAGVVWEGEQRDVRFSRALRPRANDLAVGPFRLDIVEPMSSQRIRLDDPELGLAFDVTFRASAPAFFETRHQQVRHGRLLNDVLRYTQVARADGDAHGGRRVRGSRVVVRLPRPLVGDPLDDGPLRAARGASRRRRPTRARCGCGSRSSAATSPASSTATRRTTAACSTARASSTLATSSRSASTPSATSSATRTGRGGSRAAGSRSTTRPAPSTSTASRSPARPPTRRATATRAAGRTAASPGVYRGLDVIERDRFDVSDPAVAAGAPHLAPERRLGGTEFVSTIAGPGGAEGMAHVEHMLYPRRGPAPRGDGA